MEQRTKYDHAAAIEAVVVSREIERGGKSIAYYMRELSGDEVEAINQPLRDEEGNIAKDKQAEWVDRLLAAAWCDEAGKTVTTYEGVKKTPRPLLAKLRPFVLDVQDPDRNKGAGDPNG